MFVVLTCVDHGRRLFSEQSGHVPVTGFESCAHTGSPAPASASERDSSSDSDCSESSPESGTAVPFCDAESGPASVVVAGAALCASPWAPIGSLRVLSGTCCVVCAVITANAGNEACVPAWVGQNHLPLGMDCNGCGQHD